MEGLLICEAPTFAQSCAILHHPLPRATGEGVPRLLLDGEELLGDVTIARVIDDFAAILSSTECVLHLSCR